MEREHTLSGIEGERKNKKSKMKQTHGEEGEKEREEDRKKERNTHLERKRWMRRREK